MRGGRGGGGAAGRAAGGGGGGRAPPAPPGPPAGAGGPRPRGVPTRGGVGERAHACAAYSQTPTRWSDERHSPSPHGWAVAGSATKAPIARGGGRKGHALFPLFAHALRSASPTPNARALLHHGWLTIIASQKDRWRERGFEARCCACV